MALQTKKKFSGLLEYADELPRQVSQKEPSHENFQEKRTKRNLHTKKGPCFYKDPCSGIVSFFTLGFSYSQVEYFRISSSSCKKFLLWEQENYLHAGVKDFPFLKRKFNPSDGN